MSGIYRPGKGPRENWGATCELCEWAKIAHDQSEAKIISVLHVLIKHPEEYQKVTGKDPDQAEELYATHLGMYRKEL